MKPRKLAQIGISMLVCHFGVANANALFVFQLSEVRKITFEILIYKIAGCIQKV